ncbi:MAG: metallophosphoesterase [Ferruginibacter sp.]
MKSFLPLAKLCFVLIIGSFPLLASSQTVIFPANTNWSYIDNNVRPAGWPTSHNASGWATGPAPLGYSNGVTTTVSFGPDPANKYVTTYFNKVVNIPNVGAYGSFTLNLNRDDGAVIYINGNEVLRSNMPAGPVIHGTFASTVVSDGAQEAQIFTYTIPVGYFNNGDNNISLELHQANLGSSDLSFTIDLTGNPVSGNTILIPYADNWKYLDDGTNQGTTWRDPAFNDAAWANGYGNFGYSTGGGQTTVTGYGPDANNKYITTYFRKQFYISDPANFGSFLLHIKRDDGAVVYLNGVEVYRNNFPVGTGTIDYQTLALNATDQGATAQNADIPGADFLPGLNTIAVEIHQTAVTSSDIAFDMELLALPVSVNTFTYGAAWKYLDNGTDQGTEWREPSFDDGPWASGFASFGYSTGGGQTTVTGYGPDPNNKYITTYFRKNLFITDPDNFSSFSLHIKRDDGVVVYINGVEAFRDNFPVGTGTINYQTLALNAADQGATAQNVTIPTTYFTPGLNTIAVEIHQTAVTSSDIYFDMEFIADPPVTSIISYGSPWKYLDNGSDQGTAWKATTIDETGWKSGNSKFGYGDDVGGGTIVYSGCPPSNYPSPEILTPSCSTKFITTYFRKNFSIAHLSNYSSFTFNVVRDDGYVIYINGQEVARSNMPAGTINYLTGASSVIGGTDETTPVSFSLGSCSGFIVNGNNEIAVEIHQSDGTSSDIGFNLEMIGNTVSTAIPALTRTPYLQMGSKNSITIKWKTNIPSVGRVEAGSAYNNYNIVSADETCATTDHSITLAGLTTDTKYFYRVGATDATVLDQTTDNYFTTLPADNTTRKLRFAAFGDCGRNENGFQSGSLAQYRSYLSTHNIDAPDAWLLLGDNAYENGTDAEYSSNFFNPFGANILKNHKLYPAPGNHDYANDAGRQDDHNVPYYDIFTLPTNAEIGGVPSGTEAYYSYNVGDVHFLALDSYGEESNARLYDTLGAQVLWIKADLAANTKRWTIAYWHHPPYTMGSHTSDAEGELINIRENFIRILERNGVDMIVCGHSHDYERSYLLKGYYKASPADPQVNEVNFLPNINTYTASQSSAAYNSNTTCPYTYSSGKINHGTVYVVAGSSGADGGTQPGYPHDALPFAQDDGGIFYFEVDNNRLDAKFIRRDGVIPDSFSIVKDVNLSSSMSVVNGSSVTLTASWPGNYHWNPGSATTRSITVVPPSNATTNYTVTDNFGCITDHFSVTATLPLPVSLLSFDARLNINKVDLGWTTASENNNKYFSIERSANAIDFTGLGNVNSGGNSATVKQYTFTDLAPMPGISYYRLSQTDIDGRIQYLGTKRILYSTGKSFDVKVIAQNNNILELQINATAAGVYHLAVYDMLGKTIQQQNIFIASGITHQQVRLSSGVYVWELTNDKGEKVSQKVVVQ